MSCFFLTPHGQATEKKAHDTVHRTVNSPEQKQTEARLWLLTKERTKQNQKQASLKLSIIYLTLTPNPNPRGSGSSVVKHVGLFTRRSVAQGPLLGP